MSGVLCPRCGAEALGGNVFCHRCRARLRGAPADTAPALPRPKRRSRRWLLWASAVLIAVPALVATGLSGADWLASRKRSAESVALSDLHALVAAELRYSQSNAGHFDRIECLCAPAVCLPRYPAAGGVFLDKALFGNETRSGYRFVFHPGPPPADGAVDPKRISPSSVAAFAYTAVPVVEDTRLRAFCADSSARLCVLRSADAPDLAHGVCPPDCVDLR